MSDDCFADRRSKPVEAWHALVKRHASRFGSEAKQLDFGKQQQHVLDSTQSCNPTVFVRQTGLLERRELSQQSSVVLYATRRPSYRPK